MQVKVVNSYAAVFDCVLQRVLRRVDFPTDGKPTMITDAFPVFLTNHPSPPPFPADFFSIFSRSFAIWLLRSPNQCSVALLYLALDIWSSRSLILECSSIGDLFVSCYKKLYNERKGNTWYAIRIYCGEHCRQDRGCVHHVICRSFDSASCGQAW